MPVSRPAQCNGSLRKVKGSGDPGAISPAHDSDQPCLSPFLAQGFCWRPVWPERRICAVVTPGIGRGFALASFRFQPRPWSGTHPARGLIAVSAEGLLQGTKAEHQKQPAAEAIEQPFADPPADSSVRPTASPVTGAWISSFTPKPRDRTAASQGSRGVATSWRRPPPRTRERSVNQGARKPLAGVLAPGA
jgi:hypothetical protein